MREDLEQKLYEAYPTLFQNRTKSIMESCMGWGIECGSGWYDILDTLCNSITDREDYVIEKDPNYQRIKFDQIKEKFGGLRIYYSGGNEYFAGMISMACELSYKTCEVCGNKGKSNRVGWITTLCDVHSNKNNNDATRLNENL